MILDEIISDRRRDVQKSKVELPESVLLNHIPFLPPTRSLSASLTVSEDPKIRVIAEIKKASPSLGVIRLDFDPMLIAQQYEDAGAAAISVVTEPNYFQGSLHVLEKIRSITRLPLLRKDFLIDPYQILEARSYGADAVLLIVRALEDLLMADLLHHTHALGMEALVEVHDEYELGRAIDVGARLIGINNRDLSTFRTDIGTSERLAKKAPPHVILVSESGIRNHEQILRMRAVGIRAFLIGEALVKAPDPGRRLKELLA